MANYKGVRTKVLAQRECRLVDSLSQRLIPQGGAIPWGAADVPIIVFADQFLSDLPQSGRIGFRFAFLFLDLLSLMRHARTFHRLDTARQDALLESMRHSNDYLRRGLYIMLNTPVQMCFYSDPRVMEAIGYHGNKPGMDKRRMPPLGKESTAHAH